MRPKADNKIQHSIIQ